jgi:hypothetical protein
MKKMFICMVLSLFATTAIAGPNSQPICTADDLGKTSLEIGYSYNFVNSNGQNEDGITDNRDTYQNNMFWELNVGIMKGLQAEYRQRLSESGHKSTWGTGWQTDQHYTGFSNPEFGLRADIVKMMAGDKPVSIVLAYAYTPAKMGSTNQRGLDNWMYLQKGAYSFDTHTIDALFGWKTGAISSYLGYRLEKNGTANSRAIFTENFKPGDSHHLLFGMEAQTGKDLTVQADIDLRMVNDMTEVGAFSDTMFNVTANYKLMKNIWLRPSVGFTRYGERNFCRSDSCLSIDEAYGFNGGMSVKVLF